MRNTNFAANVAGCIGRITNKAMYAAAAAVLAGGMMFGNQADAVTLLSDNFDGLALGPFVSDSEGGGTGNDWTDVPPTGLGL